MDKSYFIESKYYDKDLLQLLSKNLPDMLWVKDLEGCYLYVNEAICNQLLMADSIHEPIGKNDIFFATREREKYKDIKDWHTFGELCFDSDLEVLSQKKPMRFEEYGNIKGKMVYLEVNKAPFYDDKGVLLGTVGSGRNVTNYKTVQIELENEKYKLKAMSPLKVGKSSAFERQYLKAALQRGFSLYRVRASRQDNFQDI